MSLNSKDISDIQKAGLDPEKINQQLSIFKRGNVFVNLLEAATPKNGILAISEEKKQELVRLFDSKKDHLELLKFVPASGAATRMFKALKVFLDYYKSGEETVEEYVERRNKPKLELFFQRMTSLPFYQQVREEILKKHPHFDSLTESEQQLIFVQVLLDPEGENLGDYPKGLVPFHKYENSVATAFEEQLRETAGYAASNGVVNIHFTVSKEHAQNFEKEFERIQQKVESETHVKFNFSYSFQNPKTDTIAVDLDDELFRKENGNLLFRPGGHGALIENLYEQQADLVFIKNIDNVVIPKYWDRLAENKKMLAGKLLELQQQSFDYLRQLDSELSENKLEEIIRFLQDELNSGVSISFEVLSKAEKITAIKRKMNRPLRVCGMVKNEGEPGGGPFWIKDKEDEISLQIVERSQIDHDNYQQSKISQEATHFNPVDVVCALKNYKGEKFNLLDFVDTETSFISNKTQEGKELKALEHPGLWNGAMADWISIFVEVPLETFNPVKTVSDLLKPTHQVR